MNGLNQGAQFDSTIISRRLIIRLTLPGPAISIVITYTISYASADPFNLKAVANIFFQFASMIIIFKASEKYGARLISRKENNYLNFQHTQGRDSGDNKFYCNRFFVLVEHEMLRKASCCAQCFSTLSMHVSSRGGACLPRYLQNDILKELYLCGGREGEEEVEQAQSALT